MKANESFIVDVWTYDFSHKTSTDLVKNHGLMVFENLNINGMAKSISDAGWNKIVQYTTYRAENAGKTVMPMDPKYTSRTCSECGNIKHDLKFSDRIHHCDTCSLTIDRDLNAAINIKGKGVEKLNMQGGAHPWRPNQYQKYQTKR
jgi:putative transposase